MQNRETEYCVPKIRMAAGSGMEDIQALIPIVGDEQGRQCGRDHTIRICGEEEPAYGRYETEYAQREREAQRISLLSKCNSYNNEQPTTTTFTKGYKVTLYSDSLRAIALYAIYTNGPNLGYQRG